MANRSISLLFCALLCLPAAAQNAAPQPQKKPKATPVLGGAPWLGEPDTGWFRYIDPAPEQEPEEEPPPPPLVATPTPPATPPPAPPQPPAKPEEVKFTSAWIRDNLPKYLDQALDNPTPENVRAYFALQRVALDKSQTFSDVASVANLGNPLIDEVSRRPTATYGAKVLTQSSFFERKKLMKKLGQKVGLYYFYRSDCRFCAKQSPVLQSLESELGVTIIAISTDGGDVPNGKFKQPPKLNNGQAEALGVTGTPAMYLVRPDSKKILPIAQGVLALDELVTRVIDVAHANQWVTEAEYEATRPINITGPRPGTPEYDRAMKGLIPIITDADTGSATPLTTASAGVP